MSESQLARGETIAEEEEEESEALQGCDTVIASS
jgi:hypothetical protein